MSARNNPNIALAYELAAVADKILGDGEWHSYPRLLNELILTVPPGIAARKSERLRKANRARFRPGAVDQSPRSSDQQIRSGARMIAMSFLRNSRVFEVEGEEPRRGPRVMGGTDERVIRMISPHRYSRAARAKFTPTELRLMKENERLRDQVALLRTYLIGLGVKHEARANEIAPPEQVDDQD